METLAKYLITFFSPIVVILIVLALIPEKVEKWTSMFWYCLSKLGGLFKFAHKKAVKLDIQGSLNDFVKFISKEVPQIKNYKVEVEFVDEQLTKKNFIKDDKVILRLRKDDPYELNFVHGSYLFVSTSLLYRTKRYISKSQREALDLYVTTRLIEKEKPSTVNYFLDEYLHPHLADPKSKVTNYYDKFSHIDCGGLFYPVLLEELDFLGGKVFGGRKDNEIIGEVEGLVDFLKEVSERKVGDNATDLDFKRDYCRFAIMIIGKKSKLVDSTIPYIKYIRKQLFFQGIETIYVLGRLENKELIMDICNDIGDIYWNYRSRETKTTIRFDNDQSIKIDQFIVILRMVNAPVFQKSL